MTAKDILYVGFGLTLALTQVTPAAIAKQDYASANGATVAITPWHGGTFALGEPLLISYDIAGPATKIVGVSLGNDAVGWLDIKATDASGLPLKRLPEARIHPEAPYGVSALPTSEITVGSGQSKHGDLLLNDYFAIDAPGTYQIKITSRLPLITADVSNAATSSKGGGALDATTFFIKVNEGHSYTVRRSAEELLTQIRGESDPDDRVSLIHALFSLPQRQASGVWQEAVVPGYDDSARNWKLFANELRRMATPLSVDLLVSMIVPGPDGKPVNQVRKEYVLTCLGEIGDRGNAATKRHIDDELAQANITDRPIVMTD